MIAIVSIHPPHKFWIPSHVCSRMVDWLTCLHVLQSIQQLTLKSETPWHSAWHTAVIYHVGILGSSIDGQVLKLCCMFTAGGLWVWKSGFLQRKRFESSFELFVSLVMVGFCGFSDCLKAPKEFSQIASFSFTRMIISKRVALQSTQISYTVSIWQAAIRPNLTTSI